MAMFNVTRHGVDNVFQWATAATETSSKRQTEGRQSQWLDEEHAESDEASHAAPASSTQAARAESAASGCVLPPIPGKYQPMTTLVQGNTADRQRTLREPPAARRFASEVHGNQNEASSRRERYVNEMRYSMMWHEMFATVGTNELLVE